MAQHNDETLQEIFQGSENELQHLYDRYEQAKMNDSLFINTEHNTPGRSHKDPMSPKTLIMTPRSKFDLNQAIRTPATPSSPSYQGHEINDCKDVEEFSEFQKQRGNLPQSNCNSLQNYSVTNSAIPQIAKNNYTNPLTLESDKKLQKLQKLVYNDVFGFSKFQLPDLPCSPKQRSRSPKKAKQNKNSNFSRYQTPIANQFQAYNTSRAIHGEYLPFKAPMHIDFTTNHQQIVQEDSVGSGSGSYLNDKDLAKLDMKMTKIVKQMPMKQTFNTSKTVISTQPTNTSSFKTNMSISSTIYSGKPMISQSKISYKCFSPRRKTLRPTLNKNLDPEGNVNKCAQANDTDFEYIKMNALPKLDLDLIEEHSKTAKKGIFGKTTRKFETVCQNEVIDDIESPLTTQAEDSLPNKRIKSKKIKPQTAIKNVFKSRALSLAPTTSNQEPQSPLLSKTDDSSSLFPLNQLSLTKETSIPDILQTRKETSIPKSAISQISPLNRRKKGPSLTTLNDEDNQLNFYLCHVPPEAQSFLLTDDGKLQKNPNEKLIKTRGGMTFHFHEYWGRRPNRHLCGGQIYEQDEKLGRTFTPVELCLEAARCKVAGDFQRFNRMFGVLKSIKPLLETELMKRGMGMKPSPQEVLNELLVPMQGVMLQNGSQTFWPEKVLKSVIAQTDFRKIDVGTDPVSYNEILRAQKELEEGEPEQKTEKKLRIYDWSLSPLHAVVFDNKSVKQALKDCTPDSGLAKLVEFSKSTQTWTQLFQKDDAHLETFINLSMSQDEVDYTNKTIGKVPMEEEQITRIYQRVQATYFLQLAMIGQMETFELIKQMYEPEIRFTVMPVINKFIVRCQVGAQMLEAAKNIMIVLKRHQNSHNKMLQMCQKKEDDLKKEKPELQGSIDKYFLQATRVQSKINQYLCEFQLHTHLKQDFDIFFYVDSDLRDQIKKDVESVAEKLNQKGFEVKSQLIK